MDSKDIHKFGWNVFNVPALNTLNNLEDDEESERLKAQIVNSFSSSVEKVPEIIAMKRQLELYTEMYQSEIDRLKQKRDRAESLMEKIDEALLMLVEKSGCDSLSVDTFDIKIKQTEAVEITDINRLNAMHPDLCKNTISVTADKKAIKQAIKSGKEISGAYLVVNKHINVK